MKYSGIGGQAVMEGVMMQNKDTYAVAVRKPDHEIDVKVSKRKNSKALDAVRKIPILRGVVSFVDSLYLGMSTLMYSASFSRTRMMKVPWLQRKRKKNSQRKKRKKGCQRKETGKCHAWRYSGTVNCHSTRAVFALPYFLSGFLKGDKLTDAHSVHRGRYQTGNISGVYSNYIADP